MSISPTGHPSGINKTKLEFLLRNTLSGTWSVYLEILRMFLDDGPRSLRTIEDAWQDQELDTVIDVSHRLRSNALNIGADRFAWLCSRIEELGRAGNWSQHNELVSDLRTECICVISALRIEIANAEKQSEAA